MNRRSFLATTAGVTAITLAGCLGRGGGLSRETYDIGMSSNAFQPVEYEATVGKPVVWGNTSSRAHSVTAYESGIPAETAYFASGGFDSERAAREAWVRQKGRDGGKIVGGETYEHTFEAPGTYNYFCIPHEQVMVGRVVVE